jgi:hypothetical protein
VLAARLDVRRNSAFDLAAGATTANVLGEHFRSDPHLVEFVAHRLYGGQCRLRLGRRRRSHAVVSRWCGSRGSATATASWPPRCSESCRSSAVRYELAAAASAL